MDSLGIKEFGRGFPLVVSDDLLDFELDGDEFGGDTEKFDLLKGSSSDNSSGGGGGGGGGSVKPADQEEELEWLKSFPEVDDNFLFAKPGDIGFLGQQHSPVSVLENNSGTNNQTSFGTTTTTTTTLKVPIGFPDYVRKKRVGRKRRSDGFGQQHKHLFLAGAELTAIRSLKIVKKNRGSATVGRRCLHCGSDKTPQWRTGPLGKKTLCNACGVRYKSGRLVPEYRPANSPTFTPVLHSNSHRKIMEMRKKKYEGIGPKFGTF